MATSPYGSLKALLERFVEQSYGPREIQRLVEHWPEVDVIARPPDIGTKVELNEGFFTFETSERSILDLARENPGLLGPQRYRWKTYKGITDIKGEPGNRIAILTESASGSLDWPIYTEDQLQFIYEDQQLRFIKEGEFVPSTRDLVEGMVKYYRATGLKLFTDCWVYTSDLSDFGRIRIRWRKSDVIKIDSGFDMRDPHGLAVARMI